MSFFSRAHYKLLQAVGSRQRDDGRGQERLDAQKISDQIYKETCEKFPFLTAENIGEAIEFQSKREKELRNGTKPHQA